MGSRDIAAGMQVCAVALEAAGSQYRRGIAISAHERAALMQLWERGSMAMSELGALIPLSRAAVTALTDRLELLGYVTRVPDEVDRRKTVLSLTPIARRMTPFHQPLISDIDALAAQLSAAEQQVVLRFLRSVRHIARQHVDAMLELDDQQVADVVAQAAA